MSSNVNEFRQRILASIDRQTRALEMQYARDLVPSALIAPGNPFGAGAEMGADDSFATGYNTGTGLTEAPFVVGISVVGEDDIVFGS